MSAVTGELVRFALVGLAATATHYFVALVASLLLSVYFSNLLGYLMAVMISYFGHQRYSFRLSGAAVSHKSQAPKFIFGSLGGLLLSYVVLLIAEKFLHAPNWLALAAAVCLVPLYNFFINKLYVFRNSSEA
ncbi:MAG: GtrA family protein [Pseudomonadota bacterium]